MWGRARILATMSLSSSLSGEHLEQAEEAAVKMGLLSVADKADFDIEVTPKFPADTRNCKKHVKITIFLAAVVIFGTIDKVVYKIMMVPMQDYALFMTQFNSLCHVLFYLTVVLIRCQSRPKSSYRFKRWYVFALIGFLDNSANFFGFSSSAYVDGALLPILSETVLPAAMVAGMLIMKTRYNVGEYLAATLVLAGAIVLFVPDFQNGFGSNPIIWLVIYALSGVPSAFSFTLREKIIYDADKIDVFYVAMMSTIWQFIWSIVFFPIVFTKKFGGIPLSDALSYTVHGWSCFFGMHSCHGDPWAPFCYTVVNIAYNVSIYLLLSVGPALLFFLGFKLSLPLATFAFYLPLPLLPHPSPFSWWTVAAMIIIFIGLALYFHFSRKRKKTEKQLQLLSSLATEQDL